MPLWIYFTCLLTASSDGFLKLNQISVQTHLIRSSNTFEQNNLKRNKIVQVQSQP